MANFTPVGFIDVFDLAASLKGRLGAFQGTGLRVLHLRAARKSEPELFLDTRELTRWPELRAVLGRVSLSARTILRREVEFGRVYLEMLDAGTGIRPRNDVSDYARRYARLICGIRCNPGSILWCPPEQHILTPGEVLLTMPALWHGSINMGEFSRINLVMDAAAVVQQQASMPYPRDPEGRYGEGRLGPTGIIEEEAES